VMHRRSGWRTCLSHACIYMYVRNRFPFSRKGSKRTDRP
jgi:hypothetical protein